MEGIEERSAPIDVIEVPLRGLANSTAWSGRERRTKTGERGLSCCDNAEMYNNRRCVRDYTSVRHTYGSCYVQLCYGIKSWRAVFCPENMTFRPGWKWNPHPIACWFRYPFS